MANDGFNILVVDNNEISRDNLSRRLSHDGFVTEMVANGKEALSKLRAKSFDLVLLDIIMPDMDGYEVLETIKLDKQLNDVAVIIISAIDNLDSVMRCTELGADDYLTKPFDPILLRAAIARSLKKTPTVISIPIKLPVKPTIKPRVSTLQKLPPPDDLTLQKIVTQIVDTGQVSRQAYMHFSKAIFNQLFSPTGLNPIEYGQIGIIFTYLQSGRIKVLD